MAPERQANPSDEDKQLSRRPQTSVCMAAYNCERYIGEQMRSILHQLCATDELIVVDDASSDRTAEEISSIGDSRIKLFEHEVNQGIVETFEEAVTRATGEFLFLSDGDDIWASDRVQRIHEAFRTYPNAQIVVTGLQIIDQEGRALEECDHRPSVDFTASLLPNLLRNRFQGSAMAFRSSLLPTVLPFPKGKIFLHDAWIGACNALAGGQVVVLPEPLLYYRRHGNNFSRKLPFRRQVTVRFQLLFALAGRSLMWKLRGNSTARK